MRRRNAIPSFLRLTGQEKAVALQLVAAAGLLEIALKTVPFPRLVHRLRAGGAGRGAAFPLGRTRVPSERLEALAIAAAGFWRGRGACLRRSLLLLWLMQGEHRDAHLVIGVPLKRDRDFQAHAWIEIGNAPYRENAGNLERFTVLARY